MSDIHIINTTGFDEKNHGYLKVVFHTPITAENQYSDANLTSVVSDISAEELTSLRNGEIRERVLSIRIHRDMSDSAIYTLIKSFWSTVESEEDTRASDCTRFIGVTLDRPAEEVQI